MNTGWEEGIKVIKRNIEQEGASTHDQEIQH
jgi:hypothetical protein